MYMYMYKTCTCTRHVHVQDMYMYKTCTCTRHVHVQDMYKRKKLLKIITGTSFDIIIHVHVCDCTCNLIALLITTCVHIALYQLSRISLHVHVYNVCVLQSIIIDCTIIVIIHLQLIAIGDSKLIQCQDSQHQSVPSL